MGFANICRVVTLSTMAFGHGGKCYVFINLRKRLQMRLCWPSGLGLSSVTWKVLVVTMPLFYLCSCTNSYSLYNGVWV